MALVFGDKSKYRALKRALADAGFPYRVRGGLPVYDTSNEVAMQAIIDAFDDVQAERDIKITEIKAEGLARIQGVFPAISDFDELELVRELWLSILPAARNATTAFGQAVNIYQAGRQGVIDVNNATTVAAVQAVTVVWP